MKYNLKSREECDAAFRYLTELVAKEAIAEVKKVSPRRSLNQNSYLHLLLSAFGVEFGYTLEEAKTLYKRLVNPDIYVYEKNGQKFLKSSSDLTVDEMKRSIDKFMQYSAENGLELPQADNKELLMYMENKIEREGNHL